MAHSNDEPHIRPLGPGDAGWVLMRHAELYRDEAGFDATFEIVVADILARVLAAPDTHRGWVATGRSGRLGSIFCSREAPDTARLRLFLVEPEARGTGLARRLLTTCTDHARAIGCARLILDTHASHVAACRLYERAGFACTRSDPVRNFGQDLVEQSWSLALI
ncbi:MAG: GNAT family N-acetyltransferase [Pseudomonadota bacterium]